MTRSSQSRAYSIRGCPDLADSRTARHDRVAPGGFAFCSATYQMMYSAISGGGTIYNTGRNFCLPCHPLLQEPGVFASNRLRWGCRFPAPEYAAFADRADLHLEGRRLALRQQRRCKSKSLHDTEAAG